MDTLFFIHLRKAGGTSIRAAARRQFPPERILMAYGRNSKWSTPAVIEIVHRPDITFKERMALLSDYIVANDIAFFSSHISAAHLPCFDPARGFTIVRDPVERVLSEHHFLRKQGHTTAPIEEFIELPEQRDVQARNIARLDLGSLAIVGILEHYDEFIDRLNTRFGLSFARLHENRGGFLKRVAMLRDGGQAIRRRIEALNEEDVALYRKALDLVSRRDA